MSVHALCMSSVSIKYTHTHTHIHIFTYIHTYSVIGQYQGHTDTQTHAHIDIHTYIHTASSVSIGKNAQETPQRGTFTFNDASSETPLNPSKDNQFLVRATGGVRLVTGVSATGKERGVVLGPGESAWSVLSDRDAKQNIVNIDHAR
jgi:hypothetical protein